MNRARHLGRRFSRFDKFLLVLFFLTLPMANPWVRGDGVGYYAFGRAILIGDNLDFTRDWLAANSSFRMGRVDSDGNINQNQFTVTGHLDVWNAARQRHAAAYNALLAGGPYVLPRVAAQRTHIFHLYVIETDNRRHVQEFLSARGIATGIHYPIPIHMQEACKDFGYRYGEFPATEAAANRILSLPMYAELTEEQLEYVGSSLLDFSAKSSTRTIRETTS